MKKWKIITIGFLMTLFYTNAFAQSQWSGHSKIIKIDSQWAYTIYHLEGGGSCGAAGSGWRMDINDATKEKRVMLLSAFLSGLTVDLRCEGSRVTDFVIFY